MRTNRTSSTAVTPGAARHPMNMFGMKTTSVTTSKTRRISLSLLLLILFTIASPSMMMTVDAQSSYNNNNNNDYGYDDDPDDGGATNSNGGYAPQPPPVVDNLYYDYAARQEAKEGLMDGTTAGLGGAGGTNGYVRCRSGLDFFVVGLDYHFHSYVGIHSLICSLFHKSTVVY